MGIGEHKALGIDHTRARPRSRSGPAEGPPAGPQQGVKQRVKRLTFHGALGVDPNHRRGHR